MPPPASAHVSWAGLVDYWLDAQAEPPLEEHLLACETCSARLAWIASLTDAVPALVSSGAPMMVLTAGLLDRLARKGLRIREYRLAPGGSVNCTIAPHDDLVVARLEAPLSGVDRVDLVAASAGGVLHRVEDIPFDAAGGEVLVAPPSRELRARGHATEVARLVAVGADGVTVLGEYTFHHSPFEAAGPAAP